MSDGTEHPFSGQHDFDPGHHVLDDHGHGAMGGEAFDPSHLLASASSSTGADVVHGTPAIAHEYWFPQQMQDCVPASVTQVLSEEVGHPVSEQAVLERMTQLGLELPTATHGVDFHDAQKLLQSFNVPCHIDEHSSMHDLKQYLDQGRSVILGLDPDPFWHPGQPDKGEGHAVMITAIDETTGMVTLDDTGNPDGGNEEQVPISEFQHAWDERGDMLLVTDQPTAQGHPGPVLTPVTVTNHVPSGDNPPAQSYTVQPGDTLWDIAERVYGDGAQYPRIAAASGITDPNHIEPGETLTIPE